MIKASKLVKSTHAVRMIFIQQSNELVYKQVARYSDCDSGYSLIILTLEQVLLTPRACIHIRSLLVWLIWNSKWQSRKCFLAFI